MGLFQALRSTVAVRRERAGRRGSASSAATPPPGPKRFQPASPASRGATSDSTLKGRSALCSGKRATRQPSDAKASGAIVTVPAVDGSSAARGRALRVWRFGRVQSPVRPVVAVVASDRWP